MDGIAEFFLKQGMIPLAVHNVKQPDRHTQNRLDKNDTTGSKQETKYIDMPL
jgi:hypothetical protein